MFTLVIFMIFSSFDNLFRSIDWLMCLNMRCSCTDNPVSLRNWSKSGRPSVHACVSSIHDLKFHQEIEQFSIILFILVDWMSSQQNDKYFHIDDCWPMIHVRSLRPRRFVEWCREHASLRTFTDIWHWKLSSLMTLAIRVRCRSFLEGGIISASVSSNT